MQEEARDVLLADPEHIAISKSTGIKIDWRDGHASDYPLAHLRDHCPCATCMGHMEPSRNRQTIPTQIHFRCLNRR